jgi:hypothetical protein
MSLSAVPLRTPADIVLAAPLMLGYWPHGSACAIVVDRDNRVLLIMRWEQDGDVALPPLRQLGLADARPTTIHLVVFVPPGMSDPAPWLHASEVLTSTGVPTGEVLLARLDGGDVAWCAAGESRVEVIREQVITEAEVSAAARCWGLGIWRASREEYVGDIAADAVALGGVTHALAAAEAHVVRAPDRDRLIRDVRAHLARSSLPAVLVAEILLALRDTAVRDTVLWELMQDSPRDWTVAADRLAEVVRAAPDDYLAPPATLLAILRWQSGDGTRAAAATARALAAEPTYTLADLIDRSLATGLHPATWREGLAGLTREECRRSA